MASSPKFLDSLPLARIINDSDSSSRDAHSRVVLPGHYRLLNEASQKCLSYTARPAPPATTTTGAAASTTPKVVGWSCGVPGVDDDLHQIWTVRATPSLPVSSVSPTSVTSQPPAVVAKDSTSTGVPLGGSMASAKLAPRVQSSPLQPGANAPSPVAPVPPTASVPAKAPSSVKRYKNSVVIESRDFATAAGTGVPFRLDFVEVVTPIVNPVLPSGRTTIPNGVKPPTTPVFKVVPPPLTQQAPPVPTVSPPSFPSVTSYTRQLCISPNGAATSSFQFLKTDTQNKFLLYNPSSGLFIGQAPAAPSAVKSQGTVLIPPEQSSDGSSVGAADLKKYLLDIEAFLGSENGLGASDALSKVKAELGFWVWSLRREDFGPTQGSCRLVHDQTKLALDLTLPATPIASQLDDDARNDSMLAKGLSADPISPSVLSQIWDITPLPNPSDATITYSITNHVGQDKVTPGASIFKKAWRMIYVPNKQPSAGNAADPPSPTPIAPAQFLLYDVESSLLLGLQPDHQGDPPHHDDDHLKRGGFGDPRLVEFSLNSVDTDQPDIEPPVPRESNPILASLYSHVDSLKEEYGWLMWRVIPNAWQPSDGIYTIQSVPSAMYMDIPALTFSSPCPISLNPAYRRPSVGSEMWKIMAQVDQDSGTIFQTITNYRSAHTMDNGGGNLVGRRLGSNKNEKWRLVGSAPGSNLFSIMDFATVGMGLVVDPSGKAVEFAACNEKQLLWRVSKVDFGLADGAYYIRDLESGLFLTRNSQKKEQEPLLLTHSPSSWTVTSAAGTRMKRISLSDDAKCFVYAPSVDSNWVDTPSLGEILATTNYDIAVLPTDTGAQFEINVDTKSGEFLIVSKSLQIAMTVSSFADDEEMLAVAFRPKVQNPRGWEFIPVVPSERNWSIPSWLATSKTDIPIPNLADGVYRITNGQTKTCLALGPHLENHTTKTIEVTGNLKEAATDQLWYVKRDRDPTIDPQLQTYTITNLQHQLLLQERLTNVGQPVEGLQIWAGPPDIITSVAAMQKWMLWKQSSLTWSMQSVGGSGGLLDIGDDNKPYTTPQLNPTPTVTQAWQLNRALPELSRGYYRIQNEFTRSYLSTNASLIVTSAYGLYGKAASDWLLAALPNGFYHIKSMVSLQYLCCSLTRDRPAPFLASTVDVNDPLAFWMLIPASKGFLIQNVSTHMKLTTPHGSADDGVVQELLPGARRSHESPIPWQVFAFERVDSPSPEFNDLSSDKITGGQYAVINVGSGRQLAWPAATSTTVVGIGTSVVSKAPSNTTQVLWTILPSGTGYYSFVSSGFPLGLSLSPTSQAPSLPGVGVSGLDSSVWKLLKFDTGNYRIVNKASGQLLLEDKTGKVVQGLEHNVASQQNEWKLVLTSKSSTTQAFPSKSADRELQPTNGLYIFANSSTSNVLSMGSPSAMPTTAPRDLESFSSNGKLQVWIVEQNRENWYSIKSFPFGISLAVSGGSASHLVFGVDDGSTSFHWKFLQDTATGTARLVPRSSLGLVLAPDASGTLSLASYSGTPLQRWQMIRSTGTSSDTKLAQGTYIISVYAPVDLLGSSGLQAQAAGIKSALDTDNAHSAANVSSSLTTNFPSPRLPAGVDPTTVETQLEASDLRDAPAIASIASWFYGTLYAATIASQTPSTAPAAGSPTNAQSKLPARSTTLSDALNQIGDLLVTFCNIATLPALDPAMTAKQINDITAQTVTLSSTTVANIQSGILSAGQALVSKLSTAIPTLPGAASSNVDPSAPLTITQGDGTSPWLSMSSLASQALSQYWLIESNSSNSFTISHLTSGLYLTYNKSTAVPGQPGKVTLQESSSSTWTISLQRKGGYAIVSTFDPSMAICSLAGTTDVNCQSFVPDGQPGYQSQRWQLRRTGYYLQNQASYNLHKLASVDAAGNGVHLTPYRPFAQNASLSVDGKPVRADAFCIWHLVKFDGGKYRLYNEYSRTALRNGGNNLITAPDTVQQDADLWQFAKQGSDMWMQSQDVKKWMSLDSANGTTLCVQDPGDKERWKGWQLISVASTERGPLMSLPRFALGARNPAGNDQTMVISMDASNSTNAAIQKQYTPDNSYQRFRSYTYSKYSLYINEATSQIIRASGATSDLANVGYLDAWFGTDDQGNLTSLDPNQTPLFSTTISNTGDLPGSNPSLRIQIGKSSDLSGPARVLSVDGSGNVISELWDRLSLQQVWSYLDWDKGRYIIHVATSKVLGVSGTGNLLTLFPSGTYSQAAIWKMDTTNSSQAGLQGFFPCHPAFIQSSLSLNLTSDNSLTLGALSSYGCRFISDSSWFSFTDRLKLLTTFITTKAPEFVHAKGASQPINVDNYLASSTVSDRSKPAVQPLPASPKTLPKSPGDWVIHYSGDLSGGSMAYIVVRDASEPVYINYTDFFIYLFYPPSLSTSGGWQHITMRFNNESNALESVWFPSLGWIYNLDLNYSSTLSPDANPLKIIKRSNNATKLHIYVGPDLIPVPNFPSGTTNAQIIDDNPQTSQWGLCFDSGSKNVLLQADMIKDDEEQSRPVSPPWMSFNGSWVAGSNSNPAGPQSRFASS